MEKDVKYIYSNSPDRNKKQIIIDDRGVVVELYPSFFSRKEAEELKQSMIDDIDWQQEHVTMDSKAVYAPRLVAVFGPEGAKYSYSGSTKITSGWYSPIEKIKNVLLEAFGQDYNFALCNYYRNGHDSIGFHSDKEKDIIEDSIIASLSLGATRDFYLENNDTQETIKVPLPSGSILLMKGKCQKLYRHSVPKDTTTKPRINITFRLVKDSSEENYENESITMVTAKTEEKKEEEKRPTTHQNPPPVVVKNPQASGRGKSRIQGRSGVSPAGNSRGRGWGKT